ncbi:DNA-binding anti-repressor SinI [Bacillus haikouensis]|nr:DNA-binding anti-repressor SinI [Bacillus haikouensis]
MGGMELEKSELDLEWIELVKQALDAGISKNDIREYLQSHKKNAVNEYEIV